MRTLGTGCMIAVMLAMAAGAQAITIVNPGDSIQAAINAAVAGETIFVTPASMTNC